MKTLSSRFDLQPHLSAKRKAWRDKSAEDAQADTEFRSIRESVLRRDTNTCQFCGFKSSNWQQVHHVDDDHKNNDLTNLKTVCNLCHQVHHSGLAGLRQAAFVAVIPELTQTEVNHIARLHWVCAYMTERLSKQSHPPHAAIQMLAAIYGLFQERAAKATIKEEGGNSVILDVSSPDVWANCLSNLDISDEDWAKKTKKIRLVPTKEAFSGRQLDYYASNLREQFNPSVWMGVATALEGKLKPNNAN